MNSRFDQEFRDFVKAKRAYEEEELQVLSDNGPLKIAIDADILLNKVEGSGKKSVQEGQMALDQHLQIELEGFIQRLKAVKIELVIVLDGLRMKKFGGYSSQVQNSAALWKELSESTDEKEQDKAIKQKILESFGINFYRQEVINAARNTDTEFIVAPYFASPQIAYLLQEQKVHAVCGSPLIFLYDVQQVILDLDLESKKFYFADNASIHQNTFPQSDMNPELIAELVILGGGFYGQKLAPVKDLTVTQIVEEIEKINKQAAEKNKDIGKQILQGKSKDNDAAADLKMYKCMKMSLLEFPPLLTLNGELANKRRDNKADFVYSNLDEIVGKRFKDPVYFYLSKGLISPSFLESLSNQELLTEALVAPSNLNRQVWNSPEYRGLFKISLQYFLKEKDQQSPGESLGATFQMLEANHMKVERNNPMALFLEETVIQEEIARQNLESGSLSFISAQRWFESAKDKDALFRIIQGNATQEEQEHIASSPHELLALSYFRYLEQRQYIGREHDYSYGELLKKVAQQIKSSVEQPANKNQFEESAILYLELLRTQFPLGESLDYGEAHKEFADSFKIGRVDPPEEIPRIENTSQEEKDKYDALEKQREEQEKVYKKKLAKYEKQEKAINLICRVFSLVNVNPPKKWSSKKNRLRVKQNGAIDYDVAAFNTYLNQIRSSLQNFIRSVAYDQFQKIMGSANLEKDVKMFQELEDLLPFSKFTGAFMGSLVKDILVNGGVTLGDQFNISKGEVIENLEKGLVFWTIVLTVNSTISQKEPHKNSPLERAFGEASQLLYDSFRRLPQSNSAKIEVSLTKIKEFIDAAKSEEN